jgi:hypothetical protein
MKANRNVKSHSLFEIYIADAALVFVAVTGPVVVPVGRRVEDVVLLGGGAWTVKFIWTCWTSVALVHP